SGSTQRLVINNTGFITNPGGGAFNVTKTLSSDTLGFENASGNFAGDAYDNDPLEPAGNLIQWASTASLRIWTGQQNTNWHNAQNWSPLGIPSPSEDVMISDVANDPIISVDHAGIRNITLNGGAVLTIQNGYDLDVNGYYLNSNATVNINSANTTINVAGNWTNNGSFIHGQGTVVFDGTDLQDIISGGTGTNRSFYNLITTNPDTVRLQQGLDVDWLLSVNSGVFDVNGQNLLFGSSTGNQVSVSGILHMDDSSVLQMFNGSEVVVNSGGGLRIVGTSPATRPVISRLNSGNYNIRVLNGATLDASTAIFEYTGGNGILIENGATIDPASNLDQTLFRYGSGNAYLTLSNSQSLVSEGIQFEANAGSEPVNNIVYNGSGSITFSNYTGTLSGVNFESDNGSGTRGNVRWYFTQSEIVNNGSQTFGNDAVLSSAVNLGLVNVVLEDRFLPIAPASVARFYTITPTNSGTSDLRLYYGDVELQGEVEAELKIWLRREGSWVNLAGTVNTVQNYIELGSGGYALVSGVTDTVVISDANDDTSLPVELVSFTVLIQNGQVLLEWQTASEIDNAYWLVDRKELTEQEYEQVISGEIKVEGTFYPFQNVGNLPGQGSTNSQTNYRFVDQSASISSIYAYRLADISVYGQIYYHPVIFLVPEAVPQDFSLSQNYPNPFNPETLIEYQLPVESRVSLRIFNILGQEVKLLLQGDVPAGYYEIRWDGTNQKQQPVASGTYIYQLSIQSADGKNNFTQSRRMILMR
ncbi:MAG: T9SS type A sorting domain-containing protein, partial [bacterium]